MKSKKERSIIESYDGISDKKDRCNNPEQGELAVAKKSDIHASLQKTIEIIAPLNMDVLIEGETGTGKDRIARQLYQLSGRTGDFVPVNCAAIPDTLAESELFGVVSGAFTDARTARAGYIEAANHGVLFLDEIDSMPLNVQAKLLRVLETRSVHRLGNTRSVMLDLRIIASAQCNLQTLVEQGRFRRDLFFRLSTLKIVVPALRDLPVHILPMFEQFCREAAERLNLRFPPRVPELDLRLLTHPWSGNIRELKAAAERYVLGIDPLLPEVSPLPASRRQLKSRLEVIEKNMIAESLRRHRYKIEPVIDELGIPRRTFYNRIKKLDISLKD